MWKTRRKPESIQQLAGAEVQAALEELEKLDLFSLKIESTACSTLGLKDSHKEWTLAENIRVTFDAL